MVWPVIYPTGTIYYNPSKAFEGYTIWSPLGAGEADPARDPIRASVVILRNANL